MKTLRLLLWEECPRNCSGCCNKDWDLKTLPCVRVADYVGYDEIILTGGEPMLYPCKLLQIIHALRSWSEAKLYLYTAQCQPALLSMLHYVDGLTVTLHEQSDVANFDLFNSFRREMFDKYGKKSLRLNIFKGIDTSELNLEDWQVKDNMEWIKNCPLPENETFARWDG